MLLAIFFSLCIATAGFADDDNDDDRDEDYGKGKPAFRLDLLHNNDGESELIAGEEEPDGIPDALFGAYPQMAMGADGAKIPVQSCRSPNSTPSTWCRSSTSSRSFLISHGVSSKKYLKMPYPAPSRATSQAGQGDLPKLPVSALNT